MMITYLVEAESIRRARRPQNQSADLTYIALFVVHGHGCRD
jgi:hypothetical protein